MHTFIAPIILATSLLSVAHADHIPNIIEVVETQIVANSTSGQMCVDTEPLNDGFGWNGSCTCHLPATYEDFGRSIRATGDIVVMGSTVSPGSCVNSGTVSAFQILPDGVLEKKAELISSVIDTVGFGGAGEIALTEDYLVAGTSDQASTDIMTVFKRTGDTWQEEYALTGPVGSRSEFLATEDSIFWMQGNTEINHHRISDGTLLQSFSMQDVCTVIENFSAIDDLFAASCSGDTVIYKLTESNVYQRQTVLEGRVELSKLNDGSPIAYGSSNREVDGNLTFGIVTYVESNDSTWSTLQTLNFDRLVRSAGFLNDTLFVLNEEGKGLQIYEMDGDRNWMEIQQIPFHQFAGRNVWTYHSADRLIVVRVPTNDLSATLPPSSVAVIDYDDASGWQLKYEEEFASDMYSAAFAQNNIFLSFPDSNVTRLRLPSQAVESADGDDLNLDNPTGNSDGSTETNVNIDSETGDNSTVNSDVE